MAAAPAINTLAKDETTAMSVDIKLRDLTDFIGQVT